MQAHTVGIYKDFVSNVLVSESKAGARYVSALDFQHFSQVCHYGCLPKSNNLNTGICKRVINNSGMETITTFYR